MPTVRELKIRALIKLETLKEIKRQIEELHLPPIQVIDDWIKAIRESIKDLSV